jgi:hypothetical protein
MLVAALAAEVGRRGQGKLGNRFDIPLAGHGQGQGERLADGQGVFIRLRA